METKKKVSSAEKNVLERKDGSGNQFGSKVILVPQKIKGLWLTVNHRLQYEDNLLELSGCEEHIDSSTPKGHIWSVCPRDCIPQ